MPGSFPAAGAVLLGEQVYASASTTSNLFTFDPYPMLYVSFCIEGYSGSAIASLRFNNDTTAGNYASSWSLMTDTATFGVPTNTKGTLAMIKLGQNAVNNQRGGFLQIKNNNTQQHIIEGMSQTASSATGTTAGSIGFCRYVTGSASRITSMQMVVDVAGVTLSAGTSISIYGLGRAG